MKDKSTKAKNNGRLRIPATCQIYRDKSFATMISPETRCVSETKSSATEQLQDVTVSPVARVQDPEYGGKSTVQGRFHRKPGVLGNTYSSKSLEVADET